MKTNKLLMEAKEKYLTLKLYEKEIAKCGAYSLGRFVRIIEL